MSKKKKLLLAVSCLLVVLLNVLIFQNQFPSGGSVKLRMGVQGETEDTLQLYYSPNQNFSEESSSTANYEKSGQEADLTLTLDTSSEYLRLDLGTRPGVYVLTDPRIVFRKQVISLDAELFQTAQGSEIASVRVEEDGKIRIETQGNDPYLVFQVDLTQIRQAYADYAQKKSLVVDLAIMVILDLIFLVLVRKWDKIVSLPVELIQNRRLIFTLSKNDFKTKYAGSYLGIFWAFVQPVVTILVYWFVFQVGFRSTDVSDFPFVLYLTSGIVPWFFFQDALNGGTNALIEYNYLVKKVVFKISILPIVKIISAAFVHAFFLVFAMFLSSCYGYYPSLYSLQLIYYFICLFVFVLALVYITSAVVIFFRDLTQIISIVLQVGIWMTPIMWDIQMLSKFPWLVKLFKLNPMYYIVTGYRDSLLGHVAITQHMLWGVYFWILTGILFLIGTTIFKRLKVHFADVL